MCVIVIKGLFLGLRFYVGVCLCTFCVSLCLDLSDYVCSHLMIFNAGVCSSVC